MSITANDSIGGRANSVQLTIVIPAFNTAKFLARCVSSVTSPENSNNLEIIIIDDGSTDDTVDVADEMGEIFSNVRVLHQSNAGLGSARNVGLDEAIGEYVWFIDSDDYISKGVIAEIIEALSRNRPDVFVVDFSCADENGQNIVWIPCPFAPVHGKLMTGAEFFRRYYETTYVWLYILRRDLINQHGLRFQPRINMQDAELLPKIMAVTDQVLVSGIQAYVYVKRSDSYINNPDLGVRARYFSSVVEVRRRLIEFLYKLEEPMIMEGVNSKLNAINKILLLAYLYDPIDKKALSERLELLRNDGAYPFKRIRGGNLKIELLRFATNLYPTSFPRVYRGIRECFRSSQRSVT